MWTSASVTDRFQLTTSVIGLQINFMKLILLIIN